MGEESIYVVDKDYRIVYFNKRLEGAIPGIKHGQLCYKALSGQNEPCEMCPLLEEQRNSGIYLNKKIHKWVEVKSSHIDWPEHGQCNIVIGSVVEDSNKNLLYNLPCDYEYDALAEVNLTKKTYKLIYHKPNTFMRPDKQMDLEEMIAYTQNNCVHKDDRSRHEAFWDLSTLMDRLHNSGTKGVIRGIFREQNTKGEWIYVQQILFAMRPGVQEEEIVLCFINDIHELMESEEILGEHIRNTSRVHDVLTGLYREGSFFGKARNYLIENKDTRMCVIATDIEYFRLFNKWYGRATGDKLLKAIADYLIQLRKEYGAVSGYFGGDNFVTVLPYKKELIDSFQKEITGIVSKFGDKSNFHPIFGGFLIEDIRESLEMMYDGSTTALAHAKGNYETTMCWYSDDLIEYVEDELILISKVKDGLEKGEFVFYSQPKCNLANGKIAGAEALVRWVNDEGVVAPGKFLPILEKNGFITDLDKYIWEDVCKKIRAWIDLGHRPVPISVNVSRMDIYSMDVPAYFRSLAHKYNIDKSLLEIEITETAYVEEFDVIKEAVVELRESGFKVLIDDFGSGYSSLNMLKEVNVDVLKLDMRFLEMEGTEGQKSVGILESVIDMARNMKMPVVAEGVETQKQANALKNIGCRYAQGYLFYKPMPNVEFSKLLLNEEIIDYAGMNI